MKSQASIWQRRAGVLAGLIGLDGLDRSAIASLQSAKVRSRIGIACSGGADSLALALLLWAHFPSRRGRWLFLHFNHRLRGRQSAADARFVAAVARGLGENCVVGEWRRDTGGGRVTEALAREARHAFFQTELQRRRSHVLALGHQRDDISETMLMRLARGSGAGGLAAPRPVQYGPDGVMRVRPLLSLSRRDIERALVESRIPWRTDATNDSDDHFRNRVRRRVIPALEKVFDRDVGAGFAASRRLIEEDDEALESIVTALVGHPQKDRPWELGPLRGQSRALLRRAVYRMLVLENLLLSVGRSAVDQLIDAVSASRAFVASAGEGAYVHTEGCRLWVARGEARDSSRELCWDETLLVPGESVTGPSGDRLEATRVRLTPALKKRIFSGAVFPDVSVYLDLGSGWSGRLLVRSWHPGDRYRPMGAPGRMLLQDLFVNRKVPRNRRRALPVVCRDDSSPLWVPGLPPAEDVILQTDSNLAVQLTYTPAPAKFDRLTPPPPFRND